VALGQTGQFEKAIAAHRKAVALEPELADAHGLLGQGLAKSGKLDEAIASFQRAVALNPGLHEAWAALGTNLGRRERIPEAIAALRKAVELKPDHAVAHYNLAVIHEEQGRLDEALAAYRAAVQADPRNAAAHNSIGEIHLRQRRPDEALAAFRKAVEAKGDFADAHRNVGHVLLFHKGRWAEAREAFREALRHNPDHRSACTQLAYLLTNCPDPRLREPEEALRLARRATEMAPKHPMAWALLGFARYRTGDWAGALAALDKARGLGGRGPCEDFFAAMSHWQLGTEGEARSRFTRAVRSAGKGGAKDAALLALRAEAEELLRNKKR
jgi:superkiller protein 3